jgi:hypothetical protein
MRSLRLSPLAALGSLAALILALAATASGADMHRDAARPTASVGIDLTSAIPGDAGLSAVEDEVPIRRTLGRSIATARRVATSPTPFLTTAATSPSARALRVGAAPMLERPLARRAADVLAVRGPPLG